MIPEACKVFFRSDGTLTTTQANLDFLRENNITHDNAEAYHTPWRPIDRSIFSKFGVMVNFTPRHVIHPYHLAFLDPRGHPLAAQHRERYAHKAWTQPTWVITTSSAKAKAVVRITAQRRLRAAVYMTLRDKGYDMYGKGEYKEIEGTLWVHVVDPLKAASNPDKEAFGKAVVYLMESAQKRSMLREKIDDKDMKFMKKRQRGNMSQERLEREAQDPDFRPSDVRLRQPLPKRRAENPGSWWYINNQDKPQPQPWQGRGKQYRPGERPRKRSPGDP